MSESSQEKTEDATPRRLREARKKGQVPKSKDVSQILVLVVEFGIFALFMSMTASEFKAYFRLCFEALENPNITGSDLWSLGKMGVFALIKALAPILLAGMFIGALASFVQVGPIFSTDPLTPKPEKLNPIEGIKNMFKVTTLIELIKNIIKIFIIFYIAYSVITKYIPDILTTPTTKIENSATLAGKIIFEFFMKTSVLFIVIAVADYALQRWNFMKNMRMSKEEVKREYKQDEGDPHIKGERKRLHREMAMGDTRKAVKKADVVVTNPIHVACVLEYNKAEMAAPTLTAKGQQWFGQMIVDMAKEEGKPIIRNIPLAWSLVKLEIGDEIPEELYEAVAETLTLVIEMKNKAEGKKSGEEEKNKIIYA